MASSGCVAGLSARLQTPRRPRHFGEQAGPRPPPRWNGPWTCSRPKWGGIPPRSAGSTCSNPSPRRTGPPRVRSTTPATTDWPWTRLWRRRATSNYVLNSFGDSTAGRRLALGVGVSTYVEVTGASMTSEFASVEVHLAPDHPAGVVVSVMTGVSPHGQGLHTTLAMITSEVLGVPVESVIVAHGDTDAVPHGNGTMGSRSLQIGGTAVSAAAEQVFDAARDLAAHELEAAPADIVPDPDARCIPRAGHPDAFGSVVTGGDARPGVCTRGVGTRGVPCISHAGTGAVGIGLVRSLGQHLPQRMPRGGRGGRPRHRFGEPAAAGRGG